MERAGRPEYLLTLGLLAVGGVLGLIARSQAWGSADIASSFTVTSITVSGGDLAPLVSGAPFVPLAAVVLVPAVRTVGRRIAGGVLALLGAATMINVLVVSTDLTDQVYRWIIRTPEVGGQVGPVSTVPAWPVVAVAGALLALVAGVMVLLHGPRWPSMGARYERPAGRETAAPGTTPRASSSTESSTESGAESSTESSTESGAESSTDSGAESSAEPASGSATVSGAVSGAGSGTPGEGPRPTAAQAWDALDRGDDPTT